MATRIQKFLVVQQVGNQGETYDWMTEKILRKQNKSSKKQSEKHLILWYLWSQNLTEWALISKTLPASSKHYTMVKPDGVGETGELW